MRSIQGKQLGLARLKNLAFILVALASTLLIICNRETLERLEQQARAVAFFATAILLCEICFIVGALLMVGSLGVELSEEKGLPRHWFAKIRYARREIKTIASHALTGRLFGLGFWMNFGGAVGTSVVLAIAVLQFAPIAGAGILILIGADLIATFAWRIPVHNLRRTKQTNG